jgi:hypothetical protein
MHIITTRTDGTQRRTSRGKAGLTLTEIEGVSVVIVGGVGDGDADVEDGEVVVEDGEGVAEVAESGDGAADVVAERAVVAGLPVGLGAFEELDTGVILHTATSLTASFPSSSLIGVKVITQVCTCGPSGLENG